MPPRAGEPLHACRCCVGAVFTSACVAVMPQVCVVTTGAGRHFCDLSASYDVSAFAEFEALGVSVYTDKDEWEGYRVIKSDPVLHVEVRRPAPTSGAAHWDRG